MKAYELIKDETQFEPKAAFKKISLSLGCCLERRLLISPDSKRYIVPLPESAHSLTDGVDRYPLISGSPLLYPKGVTSAWQDGSLPLVYHQSALNQYVLLSQIKQQGEINAPVDSVPSLKHQHRYKEFCKGLSGLVLDIGCDKPSRSMQLLPPSCEYLGLDPYAGQGEFRIIGLGEILPVKDNSADAVLFNGSLDHILDYHTAIQEAHRVLKPGGRIVIASYVWLERATLLTDSVHFHHFREYELIGAIEEYFDIEDTRRYEDPKHDVHRYGFYVRGVRSANQEHQSLKIPY